MSAQLKQQEINLMTNVAARLLSHPDSDAQIWRASPQCSKLWILLSIMMIEAKDSLSYLIRFRDIV